MNNYILLPNGDFVRDDELYHWKYIKREKVGGKWRYYYDKESAKKDWQDAIGITAKNNLATAKAKVDAAQRNVSATQRATGFQERKANAMRKNLATGKIGVGTSAGVKATLDLHNATQALDNYDKEIEKKWDNLSDDEKRFKLGPSSLADPKERTNLVLNKARAQAAVDSLERSDKAMQKEYRKEIDKVDRLIESSKANEKKRVAQRAQAGKEYVKAREEYFKTPMGKLETLMNKFRKLKRKRK